MADGNCPYHADHNNRLKKLEQHCEELDDKVTILDKEHAVNRAEITGALKNLEKLPETMLQISNTMITIQNEIKTSNTAIEGRIQGVETKLDSTFTNVNEEIKNMNNKVFDLDNKVVKINEADTINIWRELKTWFLKNWMIIGFGALLSVLYLTGLLSKMVPR